MKAARALLVFAGAAGFVTLYVAFGIKTWHATGAAPQLDPDLVKIGTTLAGALAAIFATSLGVKKQDEHLSTQKNPRGRAALRVGETLVPHVPKGVSIGATVCFWSYFAVGVGAWVTWIANKSVTPEVIKTLGELMAGYVVALIGAITLGGK